MPEEKTIRCKIVDEDNLLLPAFGTNEIPIVMSSSNYYLPFCAVTLLSLLEHRNPLDPYDVFILSGDITEEDCEYLNRMLEPYDNVSVRIVLLESAISQEELYISDHVSKETYFRLLAPWIFSEFDRIIFLDSDMIVKADMAQLAKIDIGPYLVAAVPDIVMAGLANGYEPFFSSYLKERIGLEEKDLSSYFNAGLLVMNCQAFRREFKRFELIQLAAQEKYVIFDQDVLNVVSKGKSLLLDLSWNLVPNCKIKKANCWIQKKDYIECAPEEMKKSFAEARRNIKIIHYTDQGKPWLDPFEDLAEEFWAVAKRTPFYETVLFRLYKHQSQIVLENPLPMQVFEESQPVMAFIPLVKRTIKKIASIFLPAGTRRRAICKRAYNMVRGRNVPA